MATNKTILNIEINENVNDYITAVQQDSRSRFLDVMLFDNGVPIDLTGHTARIYAIKPDGKEVYNNGVITDAKKGRVQFELTSQTLAVAGLLNLQIILYRNNTEILSTNPFKLFILESLMSKNAIQSSNEYGALVVTLRDLESAKALMQEMVKKIGSPGQIATSLNLTTMYAIMDEILKMLRDSSVVAIKDKLDKIDTTTTNTNSEIPNIKKLIQDSIYKTKATYLELSGITKQVIPLNAITGGLNLTNLGSFATNSKNIIHMIGTFNMKANEKITFQVQDSKGVIFYKTTLTMPSTVSTTSTVRFGYANAQHLSAYASVNDGGFSESGFMDPIGLYLPFHSGNGNIPTLGEPTTQFSNYTSDTTNISRQMNLVGYYTKTNFFPKTVLGNLAVNITGNCAGGGSLELYLGAEQ